MVRECSATLCAMASPTTSNSLGRPCVHVRKHASFLGETICASSQRRNDNANFNVILGAITLLVARWRRYQL